MNGAGPSQAVSAPWGAEQRRSRKRGGSYV
jgi:hypothetical protein